MPKLIFTQPEFAVQTCELPEGTTVGLGPRNTLVIRDDTEPRCALFREKEPCADLRQLDARPAV